jgi:two-component system, OmpR family, sensor histidine kinase BaeS
LASATASDSAATARRGPGRLGVRLALAFVGVALAAIAVLAALTLLASRSEVSALVERQREARADEVAAALAEVYEAAGSWAGADLRPAYVLAAADGAVLAVRDADGRIIARPRHAMVEMMTRLHGAGPGTTLGPPLTVAVTANAAQVGTATLRFPAGSLPAPEREVRDALARTVLIGSGLAALLALVVAAVVSRRITRPLVDLTAAVRQFEHGDRAARASLGTSPGELGELGHAFDRMADTLAREDSLRRALVADVAHELRTPVTILRAYCEEMVDGVAEPSIERLSSLHDEVLRLGTIVDDLEALASADAAGLRLERKLVGLERVAGDAAELLEPRFAAAELELRLELEPVEVEGDPGRLGQIVTNLLMNGLKFTPPGGRVTLAVVPQGELARLSVADTGPGIPAEELPHVFERFWRGSRAAAVGGSGIGLAIVSELARAHSGRVEVESTIGEGTTLTVLLPRASGHRA